MSPAIAPPVKFVPDINGKPALPREGDRVVPGYRVNPGEDLPMRVEVAVPEHVTVTGPVVRHLHGYLEPWDRWPPHRDEPGPG